MAESNNDVIFVYESEIMMGKVMERWKHDKTIKMKKKVTFISLLPLFFDTTHSQLLG